MNLHNGGIVCFGELTIVINSSIQGADSPKTLEVIRKTVTYMENDIYGPSSTHGLSEEIIAECTNKEELCAYWAAIGGKHIVIAACDMRSLGCLLLETSPTHSPAEIFIFSSNCRVRSEQILHENKVCTVLSDMRYD
jgi:hypothetical protein